MIGFVLKTVSLCAVFYVLFKLYELSYTGANPFQ